MTELLDVIAAKIGEDPLYPTPSRSDLLNKAALLYIARCKERPELKEVIDATEQKRAEGRNLIELNNVEPSRRAAKRRHRTVRKAGSFNAAPAE